jgi:hypothetical protein
MMHTWEHWLGVCSQSCADLTPQAVLDKVALLASIDFWAFFNGACYTVWASEARVCLIPHHPPQYGTVCTCIPFTSRPANDTDSKLKDLINSGLLGAFHPTHTAKTVQAHTTVRKLQRIVWKRRNSSFET